MSGEPIGTVNLASGYEFHVSVANGQIRSWFSRNDRYSTDDAAATEAEATQMAMLLMLAVQVAPAITAAQALCRETVLDAEADYERKVAALIGGNR